MSCDIDRRMSRSASILVLLASLALAVSCGKKSDDGDKGGEKGSADKKGDDKGGGADKAPAPDFSAWDQAAKAKAWQGSWLAKENGRVQAWTITGDKVQTWDGEKEASLTLVVESPCRAGFKNDKGMTFPRPFASVGGKLRYGAGGYKKGVEAIFCDASGATYVIDAAGTCSTWEDDFGKWKKADGDCGFKKNAEGAEVFFHGDPNAGEWAIEGDAIVPRGSFPTEPVEGDFAAAKTARDGKDTK